MRAPRLVSRLRSLPTRSPWAMANVAFTEALYLLLDVPALVGASVLLITDSAGWIMLHMATLVYFIDCLTFFVPFLSCCAAHCFF